MKTNLKRLMAGVMLVCMMVLAGPFGQMVSWAANTRIAFSDPSVMVGNEVTVSMKITSDSALGTAEVMLSYDPNILEFVSGSNVSGGAGTLKVLGTMESADQKAFSFTLKFKALQAGNSAISVTSQEIYDADAQMLTVDKMGSSTVKVTSPANYSKDATLKSLKISPGTLTPEFDPSVEAYTAAVDGSTADLIVNAVAANAGASVALEGDRGLQNGENQVVVKVTAEDRQTVKNYTITVTKAEGGETVPAGDGSGESADAQFGDLKVSIGDVEYSVAASFDEAALPEGFEAQTVDYKGTEVMAGKGLEKDLTLLYLQDADGNGGFFIYNAAADTWSRFVEVETSSKAIVIVPVDSDTTPPEGFVERQIDIDNVRVTGWVENTEADPQYCLFYAMNWNGEKYFYRYDLTEKTIQRYFASGVSNEKFTKLALDYNNLVRDNNIQFFILIGVGVLAVVLLIAVLILLKNGGGKGGPGGFEGRDRKDRDDGFRSGNSDEDYYEDTVSQAGRVRKYSRQEYNAGADDEIDSEMSAMEMRGRRPASAAEYDEGPEPRTYIPVDDDDDEFEIEESLEDMEKKLAFRLSGEAAERKPVKAGAPKRAGAPKHSRMMIDPEVRYPDREDDDDFEFMDLDDET